MQFFLELFLWVLLTAGSWLQRDNDFNAKKIKSEAKKDALLMIAFFIFILLSRESKGGAA